jgi:hypothetical protein
MGVVQNSHLHLAVGAGIGVSFLIAAYVYSAWRKVHNYWNSEFVEAGRVDRLFVYPIKSCKGNEVDFLIKLRLLNIEQFRFRTSIVQIEDLETAFLAIESL